MGKKNKRADYQKTINHFSRKSGLAPGTLKYVGEDRQFEPTIELIQYNIDQHEVFKYLPLAKLTESLANENKVSWINVNGIHQTELIEKIGAQFKLHPLVMEDIVHPEQRPKLEDYTDYLYLVVRMINVKGESSFVSNEQISFILKNNVIISFQEVPGDVFESIRERLAKNNVKLRKSKADYLLYSLLDAIVDNYFNVLEKIGDDLQNLELEILNEPKSTMLSALNYQKRELIYLRKSVWPLREVISLLGKTENTHVQQNTLIYLRDVYDHTVHVIDSIETLRDITSGLMDIYLSSLSHKMNTVMKTLTIIATIFIPLTFVVGVYGMNFDHMPELHYENGYWIVWLIMGLMSFGMLIYFKRKKWF